MSFAEQMAQSQPSAPPVPIEALARCVEACVDCAQACTACADACLGEQDPKMLARCIRLDLDCADICQITGRIASHQTAFEPTLVRVVLQACVQACQLCGEECDKHAQHMQHCRVCAEACRRCEQACNQLATALAG